MAANIQIQIDLSLTRSVFAKGGFEDFSDFVIGLAKFVKRPKAKICIIPGGEG
jgi:hypothetical protein